MVNKGTCSHLNGEQIIFMWRMICAEGFIND